MLHVVPAGALAVPASGYTVSSALLFDGTADYLKLTPSAAGSTSKATYSFWVKRSGLGDAELDIVNCETNTGGQRDGISFGDGSTADLLSVRFNDANDGNIKTSALLRDPTAWQHWVVAIDTSQSTAADRVKIYLNGTQVTDFVSTPSYPSQNYVMQGFMQDDKSFIGTTVNENNYYFDGYLAEFIGIDGIQLAASAFGENDSNGVWVPKDPSNTDNIADWGGKNSFWLKFDDGNDIGKNSRPTAVTATSSTYKIDNSIWLDGSADYLSWTPTATALSTTDKTISFWVKRVKFGSVQWVLDVASNGDQIQYTSGDQLEVSLNATTDSHYTTKAKYRDPTAWTHIVIAFDTDNDTATDRKRLWINGVLQEDAVLDNHGDPSDGANVDWMQASIAHNLGRRGNNSQFLAAYLAEFIGIDGTAYEASNFGGWDANGNWVPKDPSGLAFGNNGFWLDFAVAPGTSNGAGTDASGGGVAQNISSATVTQSGTADNGSGVSLKGTGGGGAIDGPSLVDDDTADDGFYMGHSSNADCSGKNIDIDLGSGNDLAVTGVGWIAGPNNGSNNTGGVWSVFYSDNGSDYTDTGQNANFIGGQGETGKTEQRTLITGQSSHRYWRFHLDSHTANGNGWYSGIKLYSGGTGVTFLNTFTENSLTAAQKTTDSPTNTAGDNEGNYWTLNPLASTDTLTNGNLAYTGAANFSSYVTAPALPVTGKWYWEIKAVGSAPIGSSAFYDTYVGVLDTTVAIPTASHTSNNNLWIWANLHTTGGGTVYNGNGTYGQATGGTKTLVPAVNFADNGIIMIAVDMDNSSIWWGNDGTWAGSGNPAGNSNAVYTNLPNQVMPFQSLYSDSATYNFGATAFAHTPPTGFKALNTANLPAPTVTDPRKYFATMLYKTTAKYRSVRQCFDSTGTAWTPDFLWFKNRTDNSTNFTLEDSVRGVNKGLVFTSAAVAEQTPTYDGVLSLIEGGFTTGADSSSYFNNPVDKDYAAFAIRAGTAWSESAQNSNILASSGSKSDTAKFSIATWTHRTSSNYAIKHNLGTTPEFVITKSRDQGTNWSCWHKDLVDTAKRIVLSTAKDEENSYWADASDSADGTGSYADISSGESPVTSTLFAIQDGEAGAGDFIGYFFARTPGLIGIGTYTGNGDPDGPYVVVDDGAAGFRPAFLLIKENSGSDNGNWFIRDSARNPYNPTDIDLMANSTAKEYTDTNSDIDFTANGFKIRTNAGGYNEGSAKNIYIAFADQPFNLARAR